MPGIKQQSIEVRMYSEMADSIIALLVNESESSYDKILNAVVDAGDVYKNAKDYPWILQSLVSTWRARANEADSAVSEIRRFRDVYTRLQTLAKVFLKPDQGWELTSYNSRLLMHLMGAIDDDPDPVENEFYINNVQKLSGPFKKNLQEYLHQYECAQRLTREKNQSLEAITKQETKKVLRKLQILLVI